MALLALEYDLLKTGDQMEFLAKNTEELEYLVLSEIALSWDIRLVQENE